MREILEYLYQHKTLTKNQAKTILTEIADGRYNDCEISSFLTAFIMRNIDIEELKGFREALLELSHKIDLSDFNPMDLCGTGGDGKNTFNISTLSAFIVAGCEIPVAKHGNYGVSSVSGSSNVLEALGIVFPDTEVVLREQLKEASICFLHAPLFHPAMKSVAPVRKALGVKTFFNMLGPLVNPSRPKIQMTGVFNLELARMYQYLLQEDDVQYTILYTLGGYDEISLTADFKAVSQQGEKILSPEYFGMNTLNPNSLYGGETVEEATQIFSEIIAGKGTEAQNDAVLANASMAVKTYFPDKEIKECLELAKESLLGGKAKQKLEILKQIQ